MRRTALAAILFGEPDGAAVAQQIQGTRLLAPTLLWSEVANICLKKRRRYPQQANALLAALDLMGHMSIEPVSVPVREVVLLGAQSRDFKAKLARAFISWLYAFGAEHGVVFKPWDEAVDPETGEIT